MRRITAVLFDYGLVLSGPPDPAAWERMKTTLGAGEDAFHAAYWKHRADYDRGVRTGEAYWRAVAGEFGGTLGEDDMRSLLDDDIALWTQPNQPMINWAAKLQGAGVRTGILSNIGDAMEHGIRARCAWLGEFAHHTFSHRLRLSKPDAAIYQHAAEGLATPAGEILFVDDREENLAAAREAGMAAVQYLDDAQFRRDMRAQGFESLLDLA